MNRRGRPPAGDVLTPSEWRVAEAVRHGLSNPEIAQRLSVGTDAVKHHLANILPKLGFDSRTKLRHWDGVRRNSLLSRQEPPVNATTTLGELGQISRSTTNIETAEAWYTQVLGLKQLYTFGKLCFFDCGGVRLLVSESGTARADSLLCFRVEGIRLASERLASRGVEFINAPHLIHTHADGTEEWRCSSRTTKRTTKAARWR